MSKLLSDVLSILKVRLGLYHHNSLVFSNKRLLSLSIVAILVLGSYSLVEFLRLGTVDSFYTANVSIKKLPKNHLETLGSYGFKIELQSPLNNFCTEFDKIHEREKISMKDCQLIKREEGNYKYELTLISDKNNNISEVIFNDLGQSILAFTLTLSNKQLCKTMYDNGVMPYVILYQMRVDMDPNYGPTSSSYLFYEWLRVYQGFLCQEQDTYLIMNLQAQFISYDWKYWEIFNTL